MSVVADLVDRAAARCGGAPALLAPGREPLTYDGLAEQNRRVAGTLRSLGVTGADRVAVVLPNGPEMASAFLAVSSCAGCAPLNPNYTLQDFEFYFSDIGARALLVDNAAPAVALQAARAAGIEILTLQRKPRAGEFSLDGGDAAEAPNAPGGAEAALLLHTSGTTSRPKLVPLTAANLVASAAHIASTLALSPQDRCLNIMPLFHIHGLMAAVLASMHAGASVVCTDGVFANQFFAWLAEFRPTWYTAVPTMHQGILARAAQYSDVIRESRLRFIRSSSASLPPVVMEELEKTFSAPVIEAYGMTEAAHQMASNPLPPLARKPGSVGRSAGPDVAIMNERGELLPAKETGEVVIRGANVTPGYEANAAANEAAFTNGWFRTGDQGWIDEEGYLFLTGRLKELINRGGEKIAPREVDEVLLTHPAVRQALTFSVPHAQLGEEVGAAVELESGSAATTAELRAWASKRLPAFKVPRVIRVVQTIPRGPTGKLQRIGLAAKLGIEALDDTQLGEYVLPRNEMESRIADLWRELLPGARAGVEDRFEALGGDSLLAVKMLAAVGELVGAEIPYQDFVEQGTIASLAQTLRAEAREAAPALLTLERGLAGRPLICVPGHDGSLLGLARMASALGTASPVWGFDFSRMKQAGSVAELARWSVEQLRRRQPRGPYRLAGVCFGGCVALEMANALVAEGEQVEFLALIDSLNPNWARTRGAGAAIAARLRQAGLKTSHHRRALQSMGVGEGGRYVAGRVRAFFQNHSELTAARLGVSGDGGIRYRGLMLEYRPGRWSGDALVVRLPGRRLDALELGWREVVQGQLEMVDLPFHPLGALAGPNAELLARLLRDRLHRLESGKVPGDAAARKLG
ncbi:AMP-binding protein [uncultured Paludibaculum sp.]|uniref:AMP-binding protein n=1 Tax=uncultured Paludibaculum sp. TaxID=1765020 RepID=UPI002AAB3F4E|nr:AMP-binding protein [uncultured Paludibaculum sp.]